MQEESVPDILEEISATEEEIVNKAYDLKRAIFRLRQLKIDSAEAGGFMGYKVETFDPRDAFKSEDEAIKQATSSFFRVLNKDQ